MTGVWVVHHHNRAPGGFICSCSAGTATPGPPVPLNPQLPSLQGRQGHFQPEKLSLTEAHRPQSW